MELVSIELERLFDHPENANVMKAGELAQLKLHIGEGGDYEPLVVRAHVEKAGCFELLNGHHRRRVLSELGYERAWCVVWDVDDDRARMLLATLNRLQGSDDPARRARLLERLNEKLDRKELVRRLPEGAGHIEKLLALNRPVRCVRPERVAGLPVALTFFVTREQKSLVEKALKVMAARRPDERRERSELLVSLAEEVV